MSKESARKGRRLWGKFYTRRKIKRSIDGESDGSFVSFPIQIGFPQSRPDRVEENAARNENVKDPGAFCNCGSRLRGWSGSVASSGEESRTSPISEASAVLCRENGGQSGLFPYKSEECTVLCRENGQQSESFPSKSEGCATRAVLLGENGRKGDVGGDAKNCGARVNFVPIGDNTVCKSGGSSIAHSTSLFCIKNKREIECGGNEVNVEVPLALVAVRNDNDEYKLQERGTAESFTDFCSKNELHIEHKGDVANFVAPVTDDTGRLAPVREDTGILAPVRDDTRRWKDRERVEVESIPGAFCSCGSLLGGRSGFVASLLEKLASSPRSETCIVLHRENEKQGEFSVSKSEACAILRSEKGQEGEVRGGAAKGGAGLNVVPVGDNTLCKHRGSLMAESTSLLCIKNKPAIECGGNEANVEASLNLAAVRDVIEEYNHQERGITESFTTLRSETKLDIELGGCFANVIAPIRDDAGGYEDRERMEVESSRTLCTESKSHTEIGGKIMNTKAALDHIAVRDDIAENKHKKKVIKDSSVILCTEDKESDECGGDMVNAVAQSDHNAIRDDTVGCPYQERMVPESITTFCAENEPQVEVGGHSVDARATLDLIPVKVNTAENKHQGRNLAEETISSKLPLKMRRVDGEEALWIIQDSVVSKNQNSCLTETEVDFSVSGCVKYQRNGSPSVTVSLVDKCAIQDQSLGGEHSIQAQTILFKTKPDEPRDRSNSLYAPSNACLTTGECITPLKCDKVFDDFSHQPLDKCHANLCQLIDHDNEKNRTGPILRSGKIHLATSVLKKHQRRMMASMSSEGGRTRNAFINNRLKRNGFKGLLENYLKDWRDKNVQAGTFENEHCLPFLVHAPKLVECYHCKALILRGKEVICTVISCRQAYHLVCAKQLQGCRWLKNKEFKCPQHACMVCNSKQGLWRCVRCPVAVHRDCSPWPEAMVFLKERPGPAICWRHHEDWRLEHKRKDSTNGIKEAFLRLPVPYFIEDFKIESGFLKDVMGNENEPPPYVQIRRNVFLVKKKRDDTDDGVGCSCGKDAVVCGENCECRVQSMSCSKACLCSELCTNKPFRKEKRMKIVKTKFCGWGAEAAEVIKKGEFVIEYVGEVIDDALCEARLWEMKHRGVHNFYMCEIGKDFIIDATFKGNQSRFLNHGCDPNCKLEKWRVDGETRVGIFAAKDIRVGEPLTYDYRFIQFGPNVKCCCGAAKCQGDLGEPFGTNGIKAGASRAVGSKHFGDNNGVTPDLKMLQWGSKRKRTCLF